MNVEFVSPHSRTVPVSADGGEISGSRREQHPVQNVGPLLGARPPWVQLGRAGRHVVEVVEVELLDQLLWIGVVRLAGILSWAVAEICCDSVAFL